MYLEQCPRTLHTSQLFSKLCYVNSIHKNYTIAELHCELRHILEIGENGRVSYSIITYLTYEGCETDAINAHSYKHALVLGLTCV
jgi:hypothetical protein